MVNNSQHWQFIEEIVYRQKYNLIQYTTRGGSIILSKIRDCLLWLRFTIHFLYVLSTTMFINILFGVLWSDHVIFTTSWEYDLVGNERKQYKIVNNIMILLWTQEKRQGRELYSALSFNILYEALFLWSWEKSFCDSMNTRDMFISGPVQEIFQPLHINFVYSLF